MTNKPPVQVEIARPAARDLKQFSKKYPHVVDDIFELIDQLEAGETPGDQVSGVGYTVYKVRVRSSDLSKGKRRLSGHLLPSSSKQPYYHHNLYQK